MRCICLHTVGYSGSTSTVNETNCKKCEEVGVVKRVHTLIGGVHRLATSLKEVEEVQGEVQEIKDEWEDEEGEGNGRLKVEGEPHTSCMDEMTCATP